MLDPLRVPGPVSAKRMFGAGLYFDGSFFALIADGVPYFTVVRSNKADCLSAGSGLFKPFGTCEMSCYEVPADVLEDQDQLKTWAQKAVVATMIKAGARKRTPIRVRK